MKILQNPERMRSECRLTKARIQTDTQQYTIRFWLTAVRNMLYLVSSAKENPLLHFDDKTEQGIFVTDTSMSTTVKRERVFPFLCNNV